MMSIGRDLAQAEGIEPSMAVRDVAAFVEALAETLSK